MPLSTAAVAGALLHIKPTFDRNLEFFPSNSDTVFCGSLEMQNRASKQVLHLMKIFINTQQGSCLEVFRLFSAFLFRVSVNVDCS
jgi:hypothetical protein